jgi:disulfide bond formation protein DsbB
MMYAELLGIGTFAMQVVAAVVLLSFFLRQDNALAARIVSIAGQWALPLAFFATAFATGFSLYHSEILGITPCGLCWVQRVFVYSEAAIFLVAWIIRDYGIWIYGIVLSVLGSFFALYQHYLQMGGDSILPCPAAPDAAADCAKRYLFELGYITYPLMAFSVLAFVAVLMIAIRLRYGAKVAEIV